MDRANVGFANRTFQALGIAVLLLGGAQAASAQTWTGATSTDWNVAGNWTGGVPANGSALVTIPTGTPNAPTYAGAPAYSNNDPIQRLVIDQGVTVTITGGTTLFVGEEIEVGAGGAGQARVLCAAGTDQVHIRARNTGGGTSFTFDLTNGNLRVDRVICNIFVNTAPVNVLGNNALQLDDLSLEEGAWTIGSSGAPAVTISNLSDANSRIGFGAGEGSLTVTAGTCTIGESTSIRAPVVVNGGTLTINGNLSNDFAGTNLTVSSGTLNVSGNLHLGNAVNGTFVHSGGTLNLGGDWTQDAGDVYTSSGASVVRLTGAAQALTINNTTVGDSDVQTLVVVGAGTKTLSTAATTFQVGTLTVEDGTFNALTNNEAVTVTGPLTIGDGAGAAGSAVFQAGSGTISVGGNLVVAADGSYTAGTSLTLTGTGTWQAPGAVAFGAVTSSGGTRTLASDITTSALSITGGAVVTSGFNLDVNGLLSIGATGTLTASTSDVFVQGGMTIASGGAYMQGAANGRLLLDGAGSLTIPAGGFTFGNLETTANVSLAGGGVAQVTTFAVTGGTFSVGTGNTLRVNGATGVTTPLNVAGGTYTGAPGTTIFGSGEANTQIPAVSANVSYEHLQVLGAGTHTFGGGTISGTLTVNSATTAVTLGAGSQAAGLSLQAGSLALNGQTFTVTTTFTMSGGTIDDSNSASSILDVNADLTATGGTLDLSDGRLRCAGATVNLNGFATVTFGAAAILELDGSTATGAQTVTPKAASSLGSLLLTRQAAGDVVAFATNDPTFAGAVTLTTGTLSTNRTTTFQGGVSLGASGRLSATTPGNTLTFQAGVTLVSGAQLTFDVSGADGGLVCVFHETTTLAVPAGASWTVTGRAGLANYVTLRDQSALGAGDANKWNVTVGGTITVSRARVQDSVASATITASTSQNEGGNTNWSFAAKTTTWTAAGAGNWTDGANWSDGAPGAADTAVFDGTGNGNATVNAASSVATLTVTTGYSGTLAVSNQLTVTGNAALRTTNVTANLPVTGSLTVVTGGTVTVTNSALVSAASLTQTGGITLGGGSAGALSITGAAEIDGTLTLSSGNGTFTLGGNLGTDSGGTITGNGAVNLNGASYDLTNLAVTLSAGTATFGFAGTVALTSITARTFGSLTIANGTTLSLAGSSGVTVAGTWTNSGAFTANASTVTLSGAAGSIANANVTTFFNLTIGGSATVGVAASEVVVGGTLSITTGGALNASAATLRLQGAQATPFAAGGGTFNAGTSTVIYETVNGGGDVTVRTNQAYNVLQLVPAAAETYVLGATLTVSGRLSLGANATFAPGQNASVGAWTNDGAFTAGTNTVTITSGAAGTIAGANATTFFNLTIDGAGTISADVTAAAVGVNGVLLLTDDLSLGATTLTFGGAQAVPFTGAGVLTAGTSTVVYQTVNGGSDVTLRAATYNVLRTNANETYLTGTGTTTAATLEVQGSSLLSNGQTLSVTGTTTVATGATLRSTGGTTTLTGGLSGLGNLTVTGGTVTPNAFGLQGTVTHSGGTIAFTTATVNLAQTTAYTGSGTATTTFTGTTTLTLDGSCSFFNVTIGGATLTVGSAPLVASGTVTLNSGLTLGAATGTSQAGTLALGTQTLTLGGQTFRVTGAFAPSGGTVDDSDNAASTLQVDGNLTPSGGTLDASHGAIVVGGNLSPTGGTLSMNAGSLAVGGATVNVNAFTTATLGATSLLTVNQAAAGTQTVTLKTGTPNVGRFTVSRGAAGQVVVFATNAPTFGGLVTVTQGLLDLTLNSTFQGAVSIATDGEVRCITASRTTTFSSTVDVAGILRFGNGATDGIVARFGPTSTNRVRVTTGGQFIASGNPAGGPASRRVFLDQDGTDGGAQWFLDYSNPGGGSVTVDRARIQDGNSNPGTTANTNSALDGTNNTGWSLSARTLTWTRTTGTGNWSDPANWLDGSPPLTNDTILFGAGTGGTSVVDVTGLTLTAMNLTNFAGTLQQDQTLSTSGNLTVVGTAYTLSTGANLTVGGNLHVVSGNLQTGGQTLTVNGTTEVDGTLTIGASGTATLNGDFLVGSTGTVTGTGALNLNGAASNFTACTVSLTGASVTTLARNGAQSLAVDGSNSFSALTVNLASGTLTLTGGGPLTTTGLFTVQAGAPNLATNGLTLSAGAVSVTGSTLTLANATNAITGGLTVNGGGLTLSGGTLQVGGDLNLTGATGFTLGGTALALNGTANQAFTPAGQTFGAITKTGVGGTVTVAGALTAGALTVTSGGFTTSASGASLASVLVDGGALSLGNALHTVSGNLSMSSGSITGSGNVLAVATDVSVTGGAYTAGGTTFRLNGGVGQNVASTLNLGAFDVSKGGGTASVTGAFAVTSLTVQSGTLAPAGAVTVTTGDLAVSGGSYTGTSTTSLTAGSLLVSGGAFSSTGAVTLSGAGQGLTISGGASVTLGNATHVLPGSMTLSQGTLTGNAGGGQLQVGGDWNTTGATTTFTPNAMTVVFNGGGAQTITPAGDAFGAVQVLKGGGTASFTGPVACGGQLRISSGTAAVTGALTVSTGGMLVDGGAYSASGLTTVTAGGVSITSGSLGATGGLTVSAGGLSITGSGVCSAGAATAVTGNTTVNGATASLTVLNTVTNTLTGNLTVGNTAGSTFNVSGGGGGQLQVSGDVNFTGGTVTLTGLTVALNGAGAQAVTQAGVAFPNLTKSGAGTATASGLNVTGTLTVSAGTLQPSNAPTAIGALTINGGTFASNGQTFAITPAVTLTSGTLAVTTGGNLTLTNGVTGAGTVSVTAGTLTFSTPVTTGLTGTVTLVSGTLALPSGVNDFTALAGGLTGGTSTTTVAGGTLRVRAGMSFNTLTVNGATVMTGSTAGLNVGGALNVAADLTLSGGAAASAGSLAVTGGATLNLGAAASEDLTVSGAATTIAGTTIAVGARTLTLNGTEGAVDHDGAMTAGSGGVAVFANGISAGDTGSWNMGEGTLRVGGTTATFTGGAGLLTFSSGGTLDFVGGSSLTPAFNAGDTLGRISLNKDATGNTITINANRTITGLIVTTGTLTISGNQTSLTINGSTNIAAAGVLQHLLSRDASHTFNGPVDVSGTFTFTTVDNQTGPTLSFGALAPNRVQVNTGATFTLDGGNPGAAARRMKLRRAGGVAGDQWFLIHTGVTITSTDLDLLDANVDVPTTAGGSSNIGANCTNWIGTPKTVEWTRNVGSAGNWSDSANWDGGGSTPAPGDTITFAAGTDPSVQDIGSGFTVGVLNMTNYGSTLTLNQPLSVTGATTIVSTLNTNGQNLSPGGTLALNGQLQIGAGTTVQVSGNVTSTAAGSVVQSGGTLRFLGATVDLSSLGAGTSFTGGAVEFTGATAQVFTPRAASSLANVTVNKSAAGNTVAFGGNGSVSGALAVTVGTLNVGNGNTVTAGTLNLAASQFLNTGTGTLTVSTSLTLAGTLTATGGVLDLDADVTNVNATGTLTMNTGTLQVSGATVNLSGLLGGGPTWTTGVLLCDGTSSPQVVTPGTNPPNLTINRGAAGNVTQYPGPSLSGNLIVTQGQLALTGNLAVAGTLTTGATGQVNVQTSTLAVTGDVVHAGTLAGALGGVVDLNGNVANTSTGAFNAGTAVTRFGGTTVDLTNATIGGDVQFDRGGNQTVTLADTSVPATLSSLTVATGAVGNVVTIGGAGTAFLPLGPTTVTTGTLSIARRASFGNLSIANGHALSCTTAGTQLQLSGTANAVNGALTFNANQLVLSFAASSTTTVGATGTLTLQGGQGANATTIRQEGTASDPKWSIDWSVIGATVNADGLVIQDSAINPAKTAINAVSGGNNTGWTFGPKSTAWTGNATPDTNWSTNGNWTNNAPVSNDLVSVDVLGVTRPGTMNVASLSLDTLNLTGYTSTLTLGQPLATTGNCTLAGTLTLGSHNLTVGGNLTANGTVTGPATGGGTISVTGTVAGTGTLNLDSTSLTVSGPTVNLGGLAGYSFDEGVFTLTGASNPQTLTPRAGSDFGAVTVNKTNATDVVQLATNDLGQNGALTVTQGVLNLNGRSLTINGASGATVTGTVTVGSGTFTVGGSLQVNGTLTGTGGTVDVNGDFLGSSVGTVTMNTGTLRVAGATADFSALAGGFTWTTGTLFLDRTVDNVTQTLRPRPATSLANLTIARGAAIAIVQNPLAEPLTLTGNLIVTQGDFRPLATVGVGGNVTITAGSISLTSATPVLSITGTLEVDGTLNLTTGGVVNLTGDFLAASAGTVTLSTGTLNVGGTTANFGGLGAMTSGTTGVLAFTGTSTPVAFTPRAASTYGVVRVNKGALAQTVNLLATPTGVSTVDVVQGTLALGAVNLTVGAAGTPLNVQANGALTLSTATLTVNTGGTEVDGALTMTGAGTINVNGNFNATSTGQVSIGSGTLVASGATADFSNLAGFASTTGTLRLAGTSTPQTFRPRSASLIANVDVAKGSPDRLVNLGTALVTSGTLTVNSGSFMLQGNGVTVGGAATIAATTTLSTGAATFAVTGATEVDGRLDADGGTVDLEGDVTTASTGDVLMGSGTLRVAGATANFSGLASFTWTTGTLVLDGASNPQAFTPRAATAIQNLQINKGLATHVVNVPTALTVGGTTTVTQGVLSLQATSTMSGAVSIAAGQRLRNTTTSSVNHTFGSTVQVDGTFELQANSLIVSFAAGAGGQVTVPAGGQFLVTGGLGALRITLHQDGALGGTRWQLDRSGGGTVTVTDVRLQDAFVDQATTAFSATDNGNNLNWVFGPKTTVWTGGGGNALWSNNANWNNDAPATGDTVTFNASAAAGTQDIPSLNLASLNMTNYTGTLTLNQLLRSTGAATLAGTILTNGQNLTLDVNGTIAAGANVNVNNAASTFSVGGDLTITGTLTAGAGLTTVTGNVSGAGTLAGASGTLRVAGATVNLGGLTSTFGGTLDLVGAANPQALTPPAANLGALTLNKGAAGQVVNLAGTLGLTGALTLTTGDLNLAGNATTVGGNLTVNAGQTLTTGAATLTQNGTTAELDGTVNLTGGVLDVNGAINATSTGTLTVAGGTIRASNATVNLSGLTALTFTTGTFELDGASTPQTLTPRAGSPFQNLTLNKGALAQTVNLGGAVTVNGVLALTQGTLGIGAQTLTLAGNGTPWTQTGNGAFNMGATGTVVYAGSGAVTTLAGTYAGTLRFNGGGTYTLGGTTTVTTLVDVVSGTLGLGASQNLVLNGPTAAPLVVAGGATFNGGTGTSTVVYQPSAGTAFTLAGVAYTNVTVDRAASTFDAPAGTGVSGTLTITNGSFRPLGTTLTVGTVTGTAGGTFDTQEVAITVTVTNTVNTVALAGLTGAVFATFNFTAGGAVTVQSGPWGNLQFSGGGTYGGAGNVLTVEGDLTLDGGSVLAAATQLTFQGTNPSVFAANNSIWTIAQLTVNKGAATTLTTLSGIGVGLRTVTGLANFQQGTVNVNVATRLSGNTTIGQAAAGTQATLRVVQPGITLQLGDGAADTVTLHDSLILGTGASTGIVLVFGDGTTLALQDSNSRLTLAGTSGTNPGDKLEVRTVTMPTPAQKGRITAPGAVPLGAFSIQNVAVANNDASGVVNGSLTATSSVDGVGASGTGTNVNWTFVGGGSVLVQAVTALSDTAGRINRARILFSRQLSATTIGTNAGSFSLRQTDGAGNVLQTVVGTSANLVAGGNSDTIDVLFGTGLGRTDCQDVRVVYTPPSSGVIASFDGIPANQLQTATLGGSPPLVDGAAASLVGFFAQDVDGNGGLDRLQLVFSEPVAMSEGRGVSISAFDPTTSFTTLTNNLLTLRICGEQLQPIAIDSAGPLSTGAAIAQRIQDAVRDSMISPPGGHDPLNRPAIVNFECTFTDGRYVLRAGVPLRRNGTDYELTPSASTVEVVTGGVNDASATFRLGTANGGVERAGYGDGRAGFAASATLPNIDTMNVAATTTATIRLNGEPFRDYGLSDGSLPATLNTLEQLSRALELKLRPTTNIAQHAPNQAAYAGFVAVPDRATSRLVLVTGASGPAARVEVLSEGNSFGTTIARIGTDVSGTIHRPGQANTTLSLADLTVVGLNGVNLIQGKDVAALQFNGATVTIELTNPPGGGTSAPTFNWRDGGDRGFLVDRAATPNLGATQFTNLTAATNVALVGDTDGNLSVSLSPGTRTLDASPSVPFLGTTGASTDYTWEFVSGPVTPTSLQPNGPRLSFTTSTAGTYRFRLTIVVRDGGGNPVVSPYTDSQGRQFALIDVVIVEDPPIASAGVDQTLVGTSIQLDSSGSFDPNGGAIARIWSATNAAGQQLAASVFSNTADVRPTFTPGGSGSFTVTVTVYKTVNPTLRATASARVTLSDPANPLPVADAGADQTVRVGTLVTLDGRSAALNTASPSFFWRVVSSPNPVTLSSAVDRNATFTPTQAGVYVLELLVTAGGVTSAPDQVRIAVIDDLAGQPRNAPAAVVRLAGARRAVFLTQSPGTLDAAALRVVLGDGQERAVSLVDLAAITTDDPAPGATAGLTRVDVIVSGAVFARLWTAVGQGDEDPLDLLISGVRSPIEVYAVAGEAFQLDGSRSFDDNTITTFTWTQVGGPFTFATRTGALVPVVPSGAGTYVYDLVVTDAIGLTSQAQRLSVPVVPAGQAGAGPPRTALRAPGGGWTVVSPSSGVGDARTPLVLAGGNGSGVLTLDLSGSESRAGGAGAGTVTFRTEQLGGPFAGLAGTGGAGATAAGQVAAAAVSGSSVTITFGGAGTYRFRVTATDASGVSTSAELWVTVGAGAEPPIATLQPVDRQVLPATGSAEVRLDGSQSKGGQPLAYGWSQQGGMPLVVTPSQGGQATVTVRQPGAYVFVLEVTDPSGVKSAPATQTVWVTATGDQALASGATSKKTSGGCALAAPAEDRATSAGAALGLLAVLGLLARGRRRTGAGAVARPGRAEGQGGAR